MRPLLIALLLCCSTMAQAAIQTREVPYTAADGTIRKQFALSIGENSVHGSDSLDNAKIEIAQFFTDADIVG